MQLVEISCFRSILIIVKIWKILMKTWKTYGLKKSMKNKQTFFDFRKKLAQSILEKISLCIPVQHNQIYPMRGIGLLYHSKLECCNFENYRNFAISWFYTFLILNAFCRSEIKNNTLLNSQRWVELTAAWYKIMYL